MRMRIGIFGGEVVPFIQLLIVCFFFKVHVSLFFALVPELQSPNLLFWTVHSEQVHFTTRN
jgi:hypothetical protein